MTAAADGKVAVQPILGSRQAEPARRRPGVPLTAKRTTTALRSQAAAAPTVFRQYNAPGGLRDELAAPPPATRSLAKLVTIGKTVRGVPIQAVKVTKRRAGRARRPPARGALHRRPARPRVDHPGDDPAPDAPRPRRLRHRTPQLTKLVNTTELWFLPVANPDGYDFTFTEGNRLWRKNLRDNNGDGAITAGDGVDLNRNFAEKWGYDNEGSSPDPASETYRGPSPNSEPETKALDACSSGSASSSSSTTTRPPSCCSTASAGRSARPARTTRSRIALAGDDAHPAVPGYDPDISAELYTTNGDTDSHAAGAYGAIGFTPEMTTCETISAIDPDDQWEPGGLPERLQLPGRREADRRTSSPRTCRSRSRSRSRPRTRPTRSPWSGAAPPT